jgi:hypothetical protein
VQRFDVKKLNNGTVKEKHKVKFSSKFAILENLNDNVCISVAKVNRKNISIPAKSKQHKSWLHKVSSEL